jgi:hypothetical protein
MATYRYFHINRLNKRIFRREGYVREDRLFHFIIVIIRPDVAGNGLWFG